MSLALNNWTQIVVFDIRDKSLLRLQELKCTEKNRKCVQSMFFIREHFEISVFKIYQELTSINPYLTRQSQLQQRTFINSFSEKTRLDILCESSAWQRIQMKHHALFSSKDKSTHTKKKKYSVICCTSCCVTIEQVHATEGVLNTFNFNEKKKKSSAAILLGA